MIKYLRFSWWKRKYIRYQLNKRYLRFLKKENTEWDWCSVVELLIIKFTIMGVTVWNGGVAVTSRNVAHRCWMLRKCLRNILNGDEKEEQETNKKFKAIYGFIPKHEFLIDKNGRLDMPLIIPEGYDESKREEMDNACSKLRMIEWEGKFTKEAIKNFCLEFEKDLLYLWD